MCSHTPSDDAAVRPEEWREAAEEVLARAREVSRQAIDRVRDFAEDTQTMMALLDDSTLESTAVR